MRVSIASRWLVVSFLASLASCGGGGGSEGAPEKMSLSPAHPSVTVEQYASGEMVITGTFSKPPVPAGDVLLEVHDDHATFYASPDVRGNGSQFTATMRPGRWLKPGTYSGTLTLDVCQTQDCLTKYPGYTATVPYTVTVQVVPGEVHRLLPSALGVAFADTPGGSVLSRTLRVSDNFGTAISWSATSDASWLTVTPTGTADATDLVISADPSLLPFGQATIANVQLTASNVTGATIHVGLWRDMNGTPQVQVVPGINAVGLARDPYRPLIYVTDGTDRVLVYNAHTATLERTISGIGAQLGAVAVAPDGTRLYALDGINRAMADTGSIQVVDLSTDSLLASWHLPGNGVTPGMHLAVVQPNGEDVALVSDGVAMAHGDVLSTTTGFSGAMSATDDGTVMYSFGNTTPSILTASLLGYSSATRQLVILGQKSVRDLGGDSYNGKEVAVSGDGTMLYAADATGGCMQVDPESLKLVASFTNLGQGVGSHVGGVAMGTAGNVACSYFGSISLGSTAIGIFSPTGASLSSFNGLGSDLLDGQLVTTSDGLVAVDGFWMSSGLVFVPMGMPPSHGANMSTPARAQPRIQSTVRVPPMLAPVEVAFGW